jgi:hypothetical protein
MTSIPSGLATSLTMSAPFKGMTVTAIAAFSSTSAGVPRCN